MAAEGGTQMLGAGTLLGGRYRLERRIASGGMATVWLARDIELDRPVAVKALSEVLAGEPSYVARFRREARVAAGLSHPNLVRMYDFSGEAERPYLVMEHVGDGTLADRIATGQAGQIDPERLAHELLGALGIIHAAGVVHRDVKPSNVLLDRDGRSRLTDFGIAQPENATRLTRTGEVIGTLKYMAPEVLEGRPATERSDLYACGVLLGECLSADPPHGVNALVERLTAPDPAARPASADEARAMLETAPAPTEPAATETLIAAPPSRLRSREIEISGRRTLALLAAIVVAVVLAAIALGGGGGGSGGKGGNEDASKGTNAPSETTRQTTQPVTNPPPAPPTPEPQPPAEPKPKPKAEEKPPKKPPGQAKKKEGGKE